MVLTGQDTFYHEPLARSAVGCQNSSHSRSRLAALQGEAGVPPTNPVNALALLDVQRGIVEGAFESPAVDDDILVLQPFADCRIIDGRR